MNDKTELAAGALIVVVVTFLLTAVFYATMFGDTCDAPCTVYLPSGTQDDDYKIDFEDSKLKVTLKPEGHE